MADDKQILDEAERYLMRNGYICGRNFASVDSVAREIASGIPGETPASVKNRLDRIKGQRLKVRNTDGDVSARDPKDPRCGS